MRLPYILFDSEAQPLYAYKINFPFSRDLFVASLLCGDRIRFHHFCAQPYDPERIQYCFFELKNFPAGPYAFLEKELLHGESVTIVYFASAFAAFYPLFSPSSVYFQKSTGQCIREILYTSMEKSEDDLFLTPSALLSLHHIPHIREELLSDPRIPGFASPATVIRHVVETLRQTPVFTSTELLLEDNSFSEENEPILAFSQSAFIFLSSALFYILHSLAEDHRIRISFSGSEESLHMICECRIAPERAADLDNSSLLVLGELVPSMENLALLASVLSYDAGIATHLFCDPASAILRTTISLVADEQIKSEFHYRDPYTEIPAVVEEFCRFFESLLSA